ncbi:MAG: hypothetical protein ACRDGM_15345 [bacterium]
MAFKFMEMSEAVTDDMLRSAGGIQDRYGVWTFPEDGSAGVRAGSIPVRDSSTGNTVGRVNDFWAFASREDVVKVHHM